MRFGSELSDDLHLSPQRSDAGGGDLDRLVSACPVLTIEATYRSTLPMDELDGDFPTRPTAAASSGHPAQSGARLALPPSASATTQLTGARVARSDLPHTSPIAETDLLVKAEPLAELPISEIEDIVRGSDHLSEVRVFERVVVHFLFVRGARRTGGRIKRLWRQSRVDQCGSRDLGLSIEGDRLEGRRVGLGLGLRVNLNLTINRVGGRRVVVVSEG